jgi:hypothetical protein
MKTTLRVTYFSGETADYTAAAPEWAKWERQTGNSITQAEEKIGVWDLLFLAYNAMKRELAGKPVKPFEVWCDTVESVSSESTDSPKATPPVA